MEAMNQLKKFKAFISLRNEQQWLEEMALQGWKLKELKWGMWYTFEEMEPKRLIYEIDRFFLPKYPTLKEIRHKEDFLSMAKEMGWEVVVHDEDLNYYLCKEYIDGDINELHNDMESRQQRAQLYRNRFQTAGKGMIKLAMVMAMLGIIWAFVMSFETKRIGFMVFLFVYIVIVLGIGAVMESLGEFYYKELILTEQQWKEEVALGSKDSKIVKKIIFRNQTMLKFLKEQSKSGWHICRMSAFKYVFKQGDPKDYDYILDSMSFVNQRNKIQGEPKISDPKDWAGLNNDWQMKSVCEADKKNWKFVCAMENKAILYQSLKSEEALPLNQTGLKGMRFNSFMSKFIMVVVLCAIVGYLCGYLAGYVQRIF